MSEYILPKYIQRYSNSHKINQDKLISIIDSQIKIRGLIGDVKESYDDFMTDGIPHIMTSVFVIENMIPNILNKTEEDRDIEKIYFKVSFKKITIGEPILSSQKSCKSGRLRPNTARLCNSTYSAPLDVDVEIIATAFTKDGKEIEHPKEKLESFRLATIPIMVRSYGCVTYRSTKEELLNMEEDPLDEGGYFIIKGGEWCITNLESRAYNFPHIYYNLGHLNEVARLELMSKPGDSYENSDYINIVLLTNGFLYIEFKSSIFKDIKIPFYLIFRALGVVSDKMICDYIILNYGEDCASKMKLDLDRAFRYNEVSITNTTEVIMYLYSLAKRGIDEQLTDKQSPQYKISLVMNTLDKQFLPHIGQMVESRPKKIRYLGLLLHRLFLTKLRLLPSTDRDSYRYKMISTAGLSLAKTFKTQFNMAIVQPAKNGMKNAFGKTPFLQVPLANIFQQSIDPKDLENMLTQSITRGRRSKINIRTQQMINRLNAQVLSRNNNISVVAVQKSITTPASSSSKQDKRADEMRRVHPTFIGYVDPIASTDTGENVGMVKHMTIGSYVCLAGSSETLKNKIKNDADILPIESFTNEQLGGKNITYIYVNGDWIGCTIISGKEIADKYRDMRRRKQIHTRTSIFWDSKTNDIWFWINSGRIVRPLLIVGINEKGEQCIGVTRDDIEEIYNNKKTINDLENDMKIEYISPDEQENCLIARNYEELYAHRFDRLIIAGKQTSIPDAEIILYTHCEIPASCIGIAAHTIPMGEHNNATRACLQTNQCKQACGWYALSFAYRTDKLGFLQFRVEMPICRTITNRYLCPNGENIILAYIPYGGCGQEDSYILNKSSVDRGMFDGCSYNFITNECDRTETITRPSASKTMDIKPYAHYDKLGPDGIVPIGTKLYKNDVVIGKVASISKPTTAYSQVDRSIIYPFDEIGYVDNVFDAINEDTVRFITIKIRNHRPVIVGDKLSTRVGQKGVCGIQYRESDMPYTENGITPDIIINPCGIHSRMALGQIIESLYSKLYAMKGLTCDASWFQNKNILSISQELERYGFHKYGIEKMYDGYTGRQINAEIFIAPCYYQRLQKFVTETIAAVKQGPTDILTRQPVGGKARQGGLRIGEMEKDAIVAHGAMRFLTEKFYDDSDGCKIYICRTCGTMNVAVNARLGKYQCNTCRDKADIACINSSWSCKTFFQQIESVGINIEFGLTPYTYEKYEDINDFNKMSITEKDYKKRVDEELKSNELDTDKIIIKKSKKHKIEEEESDYENDEIDKYTDEQIELENKNDKKKAKKQKGKKKKGKSEKDEFGDFDVSTLELTKREKAIYKNNKHIRQVFANGKRLERAPFSIDTRIINAEAQRSRYKRRNNEWKSVSNDNQKNSLLPEIEILTKFKVRNVLYASNNKIQHIEKLAKLFSNINFILVSPHNYEINLDNLKIINNEFTDEIAKRYKISNMIFICNMSYNYKNYKINANNEELNDNTKELMLENIENQIKWCQIIKPVASLLNFKLPWDDDTTKYFDGTLFYPVYGSSTDTETKMLVTDYDTMKEYRNNWYEEVMFHFNSVMRTAYYDLNFTNELNETNMDEHSVTYLDHCYDCSAELFILNNYIKKFKIDKTAIQLSIELFS